MAQTAAEETIQSFQVLVVDDDPDMRTTVAEYLEAEGMTVWQAAGPAEALDRLARTELALVVLDLRLAGEDGLDLLRRIRDRGEVPVIVMTGDLRFAMDRVAGLDLGADDYILKPFSLRELLARVHAVLRRRRRSAGREARKGGVRTSHFEGWTLDRQARRLTDPGGSDVVLTKGEFATLLAFVDAPGRTLSREQLQRATRVHEDMQDRSIDVQILRLRRKLEADPSAPRIIKTERSLGYSFSVPVRHAT